MRHKQKKSRAQDQLVCNFSKRYPACGMRYRGAHMSLRQIYTIAIVAGLTASLLMPERAHAARFGYLRDYAKEITAINHSRTSLAQDDLGRIAKIACEALTKLVSDPDFKRALQTMNNPRFNQSRGPAHDLIVNVRDFNDKFVPIEEKNLRDVGYDAQTIKDMMDAASKVRTRAQVNKISAEAVEAAIRQFQASVCEMAEASARHQDIKDSSSSFFGVVLIIGDIAGEALTATVGTAPVVVSVSLGVSLLTGH
jgi:methyl-accepting chemotaxis protein